MSKNDCTEVLFEVRKNIVELAEKMKGIEDRIIKTQNLLCKIGNPMWNKEYADTHSIKLDKRLTDLESLQESYVFALATLSSVEKIIVEAIEKNEN